MQMARLFQIVYILMGTGGVTAKQLAQRFEVSLRTIYRDIDKLSQAGVPVYAQKGKGGGLRLAQGYVLNQALLTGEERVDILSSLQALGAVGAADVKEVLGKMGAFLGDSVPEWIRIDMADWDGAAQEKFALLKQAVLQRQRVAFDYYNASSEISHRSVDPMQLCFKSRTWYLSAYCHDRQAMRLFKLNRMRQLRLLEEAALWHAMDAPYPKGDGPKIQHTHIAFNLDAKMAYRVYDEFEDAQIQPQPDGGFIIHTYFHEDAWVYGYLLSFGEHIRVLEPERVRLKLLEKLNGALNNNR